jgi:hypothetical protein
MSDPLRLVETQIIIVILLNVNIFKLQDTRQLSQHPEDRWLEVDEDD